MTIKCCERIHNNFHGAFGCSRVAKRDGYCNQHHPEAVAARLEARREEGRLRAAQFDLMARRKALQSL